MKKRILAIDYGGKRCGLAVTDELQLIASPLTTVDTKELFPFLSTYFQTEAVETLVVGEPKRFDGSDSQIAVSINQFIIKFQQQFPEINVVRIDERFSSKMAFQTMIDSGISKQKRRDKGTVDKIAAAIILQDYLHYRK
jgi:putative Holliday junction resolvase